MPATVQVFGYPLIKDRPTYHFPIDRISELLVGKETVEVWEFNNGVSTVETGGRKVEVWRGFAQYVYHPPWTWHLSYDDMIRRAIRKVTK